MGYLSQLTSGELLFLQESLQLGSNILNNLDNCINSSQDPKIKALCARMIQEHRLTQDSLRGFLRG